MKRKIIACGLSLMLLLAQNTFVYLQTSDVQARSTDQLVVLLDEPEAVVVVNVKKMLSEIAPMLLNDDAESMEKLKTTLKLIENETGVNPFTLDKIVFGIKLAKPADEPLIVLQSSDSAANLAENIYRNQAANAKLADEINPLKNRIAFVQQGISAVTDNVQPQNQPNGADVKYVENFQQSLAALKPAKSEQAAFNKLKTDSGKMLESLKTYESLLPTVYGLGNLPDRLTAVKAETEKITAADSPRTAKIAAADKNLAQIETEFMLKRNRMTATDDARTFSSFSSENFNGVPDDFATANAALRKRALEEMQKSVAERIENIDFVIKEMKSAAPKTSERMLESDAEVRKNAPHPVSTIISRKEEIIGGKKLFVFTIVKKYPENSLMEAAPVENAMLVFDEKTLIMSGRGAIIKSLENKSANRSETARRLIAKSPDALVAYGVDLRTVDLTDFAKAFGEQKTAWQVFGALTSAGNDLTLAATVEKTDIPLKIVPKSDAAASKPSAVNNEAIDDFMSLLTKSVVGIEGVFTVRFEKKKAAALLEQSSKLLSRVINGGNNQSEKKSEYR